MNAYSVPTRLLLIEDNPGDVRLIREMLADSGARFDLQTAGSLTEGLSMLGRTLPDVVLLDLNLSDSMGLATLNTLYARAPRTAIVVLTGVQDEAGGVNAIIEGAQDYLVKGQFDPVLLVRAIRYAFQRKKAEQELQESERRYKNLFDSTLDGIYQTSAEGVFVLINPAGAGIFGCQSPEELIGKPVIQFWADPRDRVAFLEELERSKSVKSFPIKAKNCRGEIIHLETSSHVLEDEQGRVVGIEGIMRDVTEHKKLEEQYRQAQKIEAVGQLAGGVAHDFNNILTAIIGYAHLVLMKMQEDDPSRHELEQILASAQRATTLTQSLLAFSRKQAITPVLIDLNDLVKRFEKFLLRLLREDIELTTVCIPRNLPVMADSGQIEQVMMNLATNARDAMPQGGRLAIETAVVRLDENFTAARGYGRAGEYALLSVTDTGTGMDEKTKERIFEPFFTTKEPGKGTGLGLATAYGIIKKHDGFIEVFSEPGRGTTFKIYLPLARTREAAGDAKRAEEPPPRGGSETVLVAEDDEGLRNLARTVLEQFGYAVITAIDGEDAIRRFIENKDRIRLVLLDGIMPKKGGAEAYRAIRALRPDIKALFMSGYSEDIIGKLGAPASGLNYIQKPVSPTELLKKVRDTLDENDPRGKE